LAQCAVEIDGPMGNAGDVLWLCDEHAKLIDEQNKMKTGDLKKQLNEKYDHLWGEGSEIEGEQHQTQSKETIGTPSELGLSSSFLFFSFFFFFSFIFFFFFETNSHYFDSNFDY
jgi:hypothetical protein